MAHGFECARCGYQETTHLYYRHEHPACCAEYKSPSRKIEKQLWAAEKPPKGLTDEEAQSRYRIPGVMHWRS